jgi:superfamily II DNA or RNA helicase
MDTSSNDLIRDLFVPVLKESCQYSRGVGYFSSGWVRMASEGLIPFAKNNGHARWITSPILDERDWEAIQLGDVARQDAVLYESLKRSLDQLEKDLQSDTLNGLAWMVADGLLEFRLALPRGKLSGGDFHDKFGFFRDSLGDFVVFSGSYNESVQGLRNYESIKIFPSWVPFASDIAASEVARFERLWQNEDPNLRVFNIPDAAAARILQLRSSERPYPQPNAPGQNQRTAQLTVLRDYQQTAVAKWMANGSVGILEMATGAGKTKTAMGAVAALRSKNPKLFVLIACPYIHLADQWVEEVKASGIEPLQCFEDGARWESELNNQIVEFNLGARETIYVVTTHTSLANRRMQDALKKVKSKAAVIVADEVHHLGTESAGDALPAWIPWRLGLSATPGRWLDDMGTARIRDYFGPSVFEFTLKDAIDRGFLCHYRYYPHLVELESHELEKYAEVTKQIQVRFARNKGNMGDDTALRRLLEKRANILNHAGRKLLTLSQLLADRKDLDFALFYCAPGGTQLDDTLALLGRHHVVSARFTQEEDLETRQGLLADFGSGKYHALVAMRCLDEGVDVPATREAFILASSTNPIQFIQRRGRILRQFPGKDIAVVHDFIVVPAINPATASLTADEFNLERKLLRKELQRFNEFARCADNYFEAISEIQKLAKAYNSLDSLGELV